MSLVSRLLKLVGGSEETADPYRCIRCGRTFECDRYECPDCGVPHVVVPTDEEPPGRNT
ncbi:hypothetical protein [Halorussus halophilus]|uniref:hypothetical protein n=1 Tax=Halorussus halophilus TaxID=2650975 RepID=UPI0017878B4F|nr:hypothetical protein [Halorussus halophilus]